MTSKLPIFVIDDEEPVRAALGKLLRVVGIPSEMFESAEAFLDSYTDGRDGCLLVDLRMPGMSGLDLIEELQLRGIRLPAIVMTGHADEASLERMETLQPIGFLEKPFTLADLKDRLSQWMQA